MKKNLHIEQIGSCPHLNIDYKFHLGAHKPNIIKCSGHLKWLRKATEHANNISEITKLIGTWFKNAYQKN